MRQPDNGPWIFCGFLAHALLLILGLLVIIEVQKYQIQQGVKQIQERVKEQQAAREAKQ